MEVQDPLVPRSGLSDGVGMVGACRDAATSGHSHSHSHGRARDRGVSVWLPGAVGFLEHLLPAAGPGTVELGRCVQHVALVDHQLASGGEPELVHPAAPLLQMLGRYMRLRREIRTRAGLAAARNSLDDAGGSSRDDGTAAAADGRTAP